MAERARVSAAQSLEAAAIPEGETLPEGWFTRIRSSKAQGVAVAQCAESEWLTGGSCENLLYGTDRSVGTPMVAPHGLGKGAGWKCTASRTKAAVKAYAICASARGATAEQADEPAQP